MLSAGYCYQKARVPIVFICYVGVSNIRVERASLTVSQGWVTTYVWSRYWSHSKIDYSQWIRADFDGNLVKHWVNSFVPHIQSATKIIDIESKNSVKAKQSPYRPGQALRVPEVWGSQISRQPEIKRGKIDSPTQRQPFWKYSLY